MWWNESQCSAFQLCVLQLFFDTYNKKVILIYFAHFLLTSDPFETGCTFWDPLVMLQSKKPRLIQSKCVLEQYTKIVISFLSSLSLCLQIYEIRKQCLSSTNDIWVYMLYNLGFWMVNRQGDYIIQILYHYKITNKVSVRCHTCSL